MRTLLWGYSALWDQDPVVELNLEKVLQNTEYDHFILDVLNVGQRAFN